MATRWNVGLLVSGVMAVLLTACGGGGSGSSSTTAPSAAAATPTLTGTLTDAPVSGAGYYRAGTTGTCIASAPCTTNALGQFNYASGDTVTFTAAGVTLGTTASLAPASDGTTTVTPVSLVSSSALPTDPGPTAIAQFLQTLSTVTAGTSGNGGAGVLTIPTDTATLNKLTTNLTQAGVPTNLSTVTTSSALTQLQTNLGTAITTAFPASGLTVTPAPTAQAALTQGVNSNGIIGTVWNGTCTQCGGGGGGTATIYFQSNGTLTGISDKHLLAGSWAGASTSGGGVNFQINNGAGSYATGSIPANSSTGTATIYKGSVVQGSFAFTKAVVSGTSAATNTQYLGGWYATYTANAAAIANGNSGGGAYIIVSPDGTFYGITDGPNPFQGTWSSNGQGTATFTDGSNSTVVISFSLADAIANPGATTNGTVTMNGTAAGTLALSQTGTLTIKTQTTNAIPLLLNVAVSWANSSTSVSSLALSLNVSDSSGNQVANTVKSESTALSFSGIRTTTTDNIAAPYPSGGASTYSLSVGPANCTIMNGSGSVVDANSGNANAYPTVYVTCDPNATTTGSTSGPPIPLLLNVVTTWGTVYPGPGYGLSLTVLDKNGNQVSQGFVQQNVNLVQNGVTTGTTTTTNIAASYPQGSGVTYTLSTGSGPGAYCNITGGGSGSVVDANSGNSSAYPTVAVSCP